MYVATYAIEGAEDQAEALDRLEALGVTHAFVSPGRPPGARFMRVAERWEGRLILHHACLQPPGAPPWNLAASDADARAIAVKQASDTLRTSSELGATAYSLLPGYALETTRGRPSPTSRVRALDQLARSLDALANLADALRLPVWIENQPGDRNDPRLWIEPGEMRKTLERLDAPPLGLLLDVSHWQLACQARHWEPEPVLDEIRPFVRAVVVHRNDAVNDRPLAPKEGGIEIAIARHFGAAPWIFEARHLGERALKEAIAFLEEARR